MKKFLSPVFAVALTFGSCHGHFTQAAPPMQETAPAKVAGKWTMSIESPHGPVKGALAIQQDGAKLTATFEAEHVGTLSVKGTVDGQKVAFALVAPGSTDEFTFSGTVEGAKMSGTTVMGGSWSASRD
jgi:hypothetical protein